MAGTQTGAVGSPLRRIEAREKVTGTARYAYEYEGQDEVAYAWIVPSTVARGTVRGVDRSAALAHPRVIAVLAHDDAPRLEPLDDPELAVLQSPEVAYRGQIVAVVVAETLEAAREGAALVVADVDEEPHDVVLRPGHPGFYRPEKINPAYPPDSGRGDADGAFAGAAVQVDATYSTPGLHNNPMEPHATTAVWRDGRLKLWDSNQGSSPVRATVAQAFGLDADDVEVIAPHVGGGFGSKGTPRPNMILAAMAAKATARPVKLAVTRQQMFSIVGYRTPTIQRMRLGADPEGRLVSLAHDVWEQTSTVREFAEQSGMVSRMMYAAPNRRTTHRLTRLDVPTPSWMRAPGECPGMYALESSIDELAIAAGVDPIELRVRNEPERDPEEDIPWSSRNVVACLREGAERFGWAVRDPAPGVRRDGRWLVGTGVASSTYPYYRRPAKAFARALTDGTFVVGIAAADIGTGSRTALTQIAADALRVDPEQVTVEIGDSALPTAPVAGGSAGTASWGTAVVRACEALLARLEERGGAVGGEPVEATADTKEEVEQAEGFASYAFGAQFAEVRVDLDTAEVRVSRMLGVFAAGRIVNPRTARSQLIGGMTMGVGMALLEEGVMDPLFGDYLNHDLAQYHVAACADLPNIEAHWIEEDDPHLNPMGTKGIGEIGIVGTAAAVANAVHHATGVRVRDLPIRPDKLLGRLPA